MPISYTNTNLRSSPVYKSHSNTKQTFIWMLLLACSSCAFRFSMLSSPSFSPSLSAVATRWALKLWWTICELPNDCVAVMAEHFFVVMSEFIELIYNVFFISAEGLHVPGFERLFNTLQLLLHFLKYDNFLHFLRGKLHVAGRKWLKSRHLYSSF